jgi:hypothetical protein
MVYPNVGKTERGDVYTSPRFFLSRYNSREKVSREKAAVRPVTTTVGIERRPCHYLF